MTGSFTHCIRQAIVNARCAELGKLIEEKPEVEIKNIRQGVLEQILDCAFQIGESNRLVSLPLSRRVL